MHLFTTIIVGLTAILALIDPGNAATTYKKPGQAIVQPDANQKANNKGRVVIHPAFVNAGKKPGLEVWRIENFQPVAYPQNDYGKFYTGDSYIVLFTKEKNGVFSWDLHFWLGQETSQDESGAAAALTVQLDDQLGGAPVQYREVQEHESQNFKSHFKNGIRYLPGGVASGFRHVDNTVQKKLYHVKGKRNVRVKQVEFSVASMNKGDCFILDNGNEIYVYVGPNSKRVEKLKAVSAANLIRDQDHSGRSKVTVIDEFSTEDESQNFFQVLGSGSPKQIPDESSGGDDEQFEKNEENHVVLHKVSDASGSMKVEKLTQKPLKQDQLNTNDCFILDTGCADIFVWIGKKCNAKEKSEAMSKAQSFLQAQHCPSWARAQRVVELAEPSLFRLYFSTWQGTGELHSRLIRNVDEQAYLRAYHSMILPNGRLTIHHIPYLEQNGLDEDDVVIIDTGSDVYVWNGRDASDEEKFLSLEKAKKLLQKNNEDLITNKGILYVIQQGEETENFISFFPKWNENFWNTKQSYEERKNYIMNL